MSRSYHVLLISLTCCTLQSACSGAKEDIYHFNLKNPNLFNNNAQKPKGPSPDHLYRHAIMEAIQLFNSQKTQINFTKVHFINVWGDKDHGVQEMLVKLNNMKSILSQKVNTLETQLAREISPRERTIMPVKWSMIDMLAKGWKEMEAFIEKKCTGKNLTKSQEDELYPLREWLKFSDQEMALPYDSMKGHMEKVLAAEPPRRYTLPSSTSSTFL